MPGQGGRCRLLAAACSPVEPRRAARPCAGLAAAAVLVSRDGCGQGAACPPEAGDQRALDQDRVLAGGMTSGEKEGRQPPDPLSMYAIVNAVVREGSGGRPGCRAPCSSARPCAAPGGSRRPGRPGRGRAGRPGPGPPRGDRAGLRRDRAADACSVHHRDVSPGGTGRSPWRESASGADPAGRWR